MGVFKMSTKIVSEMSNFIEKNICEMSKTKMFNLMIRGALARHNVKVRKVYTEKMKNKNNLLNYNMGFVVNQKISNDCLNEIQLLSNHFSSNIIVKQTETDHCGNMMYGSNLKNYYLRFNNV